MRRDADIALLRSFVAVAQTGGMTSAARLLNVTQAAVSQQVKRLEEFYGQPLLERDARRMRLTAMGERLFAYAQRMLALNDELWGAMTSRAFEGEARLGVPHDLVSGFLPPILRAFSKAWPRVLVVLNCSTTPKLLAGLEAGEIDLTLTTEIAPGREGEMLLADRLVWVGAKGGDAHRRRPMPVSFGEKTCAFRETAAQALTDVGRDWQVVCETSHFNPHCATIEADLAVAPMMQVTVPRNLIVLGPETGLPALPDFYINLRLPGAGAGEIALELARFIRNGFAERARSAAA